jgi:hypothetical protein
MSSHRIKTGFINSQSNVTKKIDLEMSKINVGSDSTIISMILAKFRSPGWLKWTENIEPISTFSGIRDIVVRHQKVFINS